MQNQFNSLYLRSTASIQNGGAVSGFLSIVRFTFGYMVDCAHVTHNEPCLALGVKLDFVLPYSLALYCSLLRGYQTLLSL